MIRKLFLVVALALALVGCGSDDGESTGTTATTSPRLAGTITVSAGSSLTEAFDTIVEQFEAANPGTTVEVNYDSSTTLAQQIIDGAPVDAFASADEANMTKLVDAGKVDGEPVIIATNSLAIVVKPGNPQDVQTLADLADVGVVSLCGETVPCGRFAQQALDEAGVVIPTDRITRGQNVKATVSAVSEGDADAGIAYVTDVTAAGATVEGIPIPESQNVVATYPMAVLVDSGAAELAEAFLAYVAGPEGQAVLSAFGFSPP
jgi:molybdate transport system substrate-binding protein